MNVDVEITRRGSTDVSLRRDVLQSRGIGVQRPAKKHAGDTTPTGRRKGHLPDKTCVAFNDRILLPLR